MNQTEEDTMGSQPTIEALQDAMRRSEYNLKLSARHLAAVSLMLHPDRSEKGRAEYLAAQAANLHSAAQRLAEDINEMK